MRVRDIFKSTGTLDETYVRRDNGQFESAFRDGIFAEGKLTLLTGPSKTGKTTLYKRVFAEENLLPVIVRCDRNLDAVDFWHRALEAAGAEVQVSETQSSGATVKGTGTVGGSLGTGLFAKVKGETGVGIESTRNNSQVVSRISSKASPSQLIPLLKSRKAILVVEDFHYLDKEVKAIVFQQWKVFIDEGISVVVVGTTHHAVDLAFANSDLLGRIHLINMSSWSIPDLKKIGSSGFNALGVQITEIALERMATESAGIPLIMQEICANILFEKGLLEVDKNTIIVNLNESDVNPALHRVATTCFQFFEPIYQRLVLGMRKRARRFDTYQLILLAFTLNPIAFSLNKQEIYERIKSLNLDKNDIPPITAINSTLSRLPKIQDRFDMELLDWLPDQDMMWITEPSFLFYMRWREPSKDIGYDFIQELLVAMDGTLAMVKEELNARRKRGI